MKTFFSPVVAIVATAFASITETTLTVLSRVPGVPDFRSVDYALNGFTKVQARLEAAQNVASSRANNYAALADRYDALAADAEAEAERAFTVKLRISRLLD